MEDHFGEVYYSDFFDQYIVVVDYRHDDHWYFVRRGMKVILRNRTKLSEMGPLISWRARD